MRQEIRKEIGSIEPFDPIEETTISEVLEWIDSGAELCRLEKPATPKKHLVSYFVLVDGEQLLLVDHINAQRWLPTGGHVEPNEHPRQTALRELQEELGIEANFLLDHPVLVTSTETVGRTSGHTDVSIWYALKGNSSDEFQIDEAEFNEARWFSRDGLPENTDPQLPRFVEKLYRQLSVFQSTDSV